MLCIPLFICVSLSSSQCRIEVCDWRSQVSEQKYSRCLLHAYNSPGTTDSVENKALSPTWSRPSLAGFYLDLEPGTGILRMYSRRWLWVSSDLGCDLTTQPVSTDAHFPSLVLQPFLWISGAPPNPHFSDRSLSHLWELASVSVVYNQELRFVPVANSASGITPKAVPLFQLTLPSPSTSCLILIRPWTRSQEPEVLPSFCFVSVGK